MADRGDSQRFRLPGFLRREILRLYELLNQVAPSPAAQLGRVVAVAEAGDLTSAFALLDGVPRSPRWHAVRGELLARQDRYAEAAEELAEALASAPPNHPERAHRERWRQALLRQAQAK